MTPAQVFHFDSVDSTNDVAKRLIADGQIHGRAYIVAREQTAGRGQRGRPWLSPRDAGIYLSTVDFPAAMTTPVTRFFTLAAGIACVEALRHVAGVDARLKRFNDLYSAGGKLGGILTEAVLEGDCIRAVVTGVGINVRRAPRLLPPGTAQPVSLQEVVPPAQFWCFDNARMILDLANRVFAWNTVVASGDVERVQEEWERYRLRDAQAADLVI